MYNVRVRLYNAQYNQLIFSAASFFIRYNAVSDISGINSPVFLTIGTGKVIRYSRYPLQTDPL